MLSLQVQVQAQNWLVMWVLSLVSRTDSTPLQQALPTRQYKRQSNLVKKLKINGKCADIGRKSNFGL